MKLSSTAPHGAVQPLHVRPATAADRCFIRELSARVFARFGDYETTLPLMAALPDVRTFVAEAGTEAVGYAMVTFDTPAEAELLAIAVRPEWQAQGVGRLLLRQAESAARNHVDPQALATMHLSVALDNHSARCMFERSGYEYLPDDQGVYPGGQPSIRMRKRLRLDDRAV